MVFLRIFTIFVVINRVKSQHHCASNQSVSAFNATLLCTLATLNYSVQGEEYKAVLIDAYEEPLWVGYAEVTFAYKGCLDISPPNQITGTNPSSHIEANPAACYFHCNSSYIGIETYMQNNRNGIVNCHCLQNLPDEKDLTYMGCLSDCTFPNNTLCGEKNAVSIYQKVTSNVRLVVHYDIIKGPTHCQAYQPSSGSENSFFFWSKCGDGHRRICRNDSGSLILGPYDSWNLAMIGCAKNGSLPPFSSTDLSNVKNETGPVWTSIIRSFYICNSQDSNCGSTANQGYITSDSENGSYSLQFGFDGLLKALCEAPNDTACTRPTTTTPAVTDGSSTLSSTTTTASIDDNNTIDQPITTNSTTFTKPVAVYIIVPTVVICIAAVAGFILGRRRKLLFKKSPGKERMQNGRTSIDDFGTAISNSAYEGNGAVRHDHFVLEPVNEYAAIRDTDIAQASNDYEYDTTTAVHAKANGDLATGNIYNRLDEVTDDTYNHCDKKTLVCDDTYSHIKDENMFGPASDSRGLTSAGMRSANDTYSHISKKAYVEENTTLTKPENAHSDTTEDDDTYHHTGAFKEKSPLKAFKPESNKKLEDQTAENKQNIDDSVRPNYDYAYGIAAKGKESQKPGMFTLSELQNSGDYDFAKEPYATAPGYELAKPTPVYMELSNE